MTVCTTQQFPELKFKYVEEDHPEEFFIPYVWMLIHTQSGLYWPAGNIRLRHNSSDSEPVTPATPTTPVSNGDSRYHIDHQLVTEITTVRRYTD